MMAWQPSCFTFAELDFIIEDDAKLSKGERDANKDAREAKMELYQLDYVLHEPHQDQGWLYMAEIPELPGCRAWGESADEALTELSKVAKQFILSYKDRGKTLPTGIALSETGRGRISVAV